MRTPRILPIAGALGLALTVALVWYGDHISDAAPDVDSVPTSSSSSFSSSSGFVDRAEPAFEAGSDVSSRGRATSAAEARRLELSAALLASEARASSGSAEPADRADPAFETARSTLAKAIGERLPTLVLSDNELDDLADATLRLRAAQAALREIPETRGQADRRARERRQLEQAILEFIEIVEMTPAEFAQRVEPGFGIDEWEPADDTPEEVLLRPIQPRKGSE